MAPAYDLLVAAARGHIGIDHRFLHAILDDPARSIPDLVRFASEPWENHRVNLEDDLILIARHLRAQELIPFLVDCVRRCGNDVPDLLVETVCGFRGAALEPLLELYRSHSPSEVSEVPFMLSALGVRDERIEDILRRVSEEDPEEGEFCRRIYREVSKGTEEIEPEDIWALYSEIASPPFEILPEEERLEFLKSPSVEFRRAAASSLSPAETELPQGIRDQLVEIARSDPDPAVRGLCWRALSPDPEDEALREEMRKRLSHPGAPPAERAGLVVALSDETETQRVRDQILELADYPETRAAALETVWRSMDPTFAPLVKSHLNDPDPDVREQAVLGIGYLRITTEVGRLRAMFEDPRLRPAALLAYAFAFPIDVSTGHTEGLLRKIDDMAGGLLPEEAELVHNALDQRMLVHGGA